jgi:hypothetical protein
MPRHSLDRSAYYRMYYEAKKEQIRNRYFEKKEQKLREEELYKPYGGEKNYYKSILIKHGFLTINLH